mgnify:CR=1 FL=1
MFFKKNEIFIFLFFQMTIFLKFFCEKIFKKKNLKLINEKRYKKCFVLKKILFINKSFMKILCI